MSFSRGDSAAAPASPAARPAMWDILSWSAIARIGRMTRKELRETLRDRRTVITLVLMPLLVYPLLAMVFNQFVLASAGNQQPRHWRIVVDSIDSQQYFKLDLHTGDRLLKQIPQAFTNDGQTLRYQAPTELAGETITLDDLDYFIAQDLESAVINGEFEIGVRFKSISQANTLGSAPQQHYYEFVFPDDSPQGRRLASYFEQRLWAKNEFLLRVELAKSGRPDEVATFWRLQTLPRKAGNLFSLATLVPLILVLMTITGAVYPAIDLTAGERERGTLEALMAAPVPRLGLLLAKYIAVLTVAMLTATVNLTAMTTTIYSTGLGKMLLGERGLSLTSVAIVFALLILFAAFFSAVLLTITSFARSFKEAQAYLIPLMLLSITPGLFSVMPGIQLSPILAVTPLVNIVLLSRDVLQGAADPYLGATAVLSTALYAMAALALGARIFGSDAILYGSQGSWSDLIRRPDHPLPAPTITAVAFAAAFLYPLYFVVSGLLTFAKDLPIGTRMQANAAATIYLFGLFPALIVYWQRVRLTQGLGLRRPSLLALLGSLLLGCSLWICCLELMLYLRSAGFSTLTADKVAEFTTLLKKAIAEWRALPIYAILLTTAVLPAICEELFFRGFVLGALRGRVPMWSAILISATLFGFFHLSVGGVILIERVVSSALLGVILGWLFWRTGSIFPGILMHLLNNGILLAGGYYSPELEQRGWDVSGAQHLPLPWVAASAAIASLGLFCVWAGGGRQDAGDG